MAGLIRNYTKLSDAQLDVKAQAIIVSLMDNIYFPDPTPTLAEFTAIKNTYSTALGNTVGRDRTAIALKNQARTVLLDTMKLLALNLEDTAKEDPAKLVSSGFDLSGGGENVPPLAAPSNFRVLDGINPGEIKMIASAVARAASYIHEYTEDPLTPASKWNSKGSTSREHLLTGLPIGARIHVRTIAVGRKGQEASTNILSRIVQ